MIYKLKFHPNYGERKQITSKSKAILIKPNYAAQDLVTKVKQLNLERKNNSRDLTTKGLRLKVLSRILITCFFGSQHIDEFFYFFSQVFYFIFCF